jgi:hypothetical protein
LHALGNEIEFKSQPDPNVSFSSSTTNLHTKKEKIKILSSLKEESELTENQKNLIPRRQRSNSFGETKERKIQIRIYYK